MEGTMSAWTGLKSPDGPDTFVVRAVLGILRVLNHLTFYHWVAKAFTISWLFVDVWVICWLLAAIAGYFIAAFDLWGMFQFLILWLGATRVLEITTFHLGELLGASSASRSLRSYRRSLVLLIFNYVEIIFWFATLYLSLHNLGWLDAGFAPALAALKESVGLMVANSSNLLDLKSNVLPLAAGTLQSMVGLFVTTVVAARLISLLPTPGTLDPTEIEADPGVAHDR
jgi:hypothetical protein